MDARFLLAPSVLSVYCTLSCWYAPKNHGIRQLGVSKSRHGRHAHAAWLVTTCSSSCGSLPMAVWNLELPDTALTFEQAAAESRSM
jgi:hypothetical protein